MNDQDDVLEHNVETLLESGGTPPRIDDAARARIRSALVAKHGVTRSSLRRPAFVAAFGLAAVAAAALIIGRDPRPTPQPSSQLADGSTYITEPGAKVTVLGPRHVRVDGAALLDVAPGKGTFVVETAHGRIEVLGTRFLVDGEADQTTAAVVRGVVKLEDVTLHAGEQGVAKAGHVTRGPAPRLSHLVSWAQQARKRLENGNQPVHHGSLVARDLRGQESPLPLARLAVDVVVEDHVARVALDQTFHNPQNRVLEGVYNFAIPPDAALQRLAMYVDGKLTESAVVERMRARRIYEELVYRRIDPALLEYAGSGRLNLRVYPLPARQDKRLVVAYTQTVAQLYNDWTLTVPMPDVDGTVGDFMVNARIAGCAQCELSSPGLPITLERNGDDAVVKLHHTGVAVGDSIVLHVRERTSGVSVSTKLDGADRYLRVRAPVVLDNAPREYKRRDWVIVDDVSASRDPMELRAQADVVDAVLRELDEDDRVALIASDVEARTKLPLTRVADVDRRTVREALKAEGGVGATDLSAALAAATALGSHIIYIGDGVITSGPRTLDTLRAQLAGKATFVGIGIGDGPDTQTLDALADATGGYSTTIDLGDDLEWRVFDLVSTLNTTRITGLSAQLLDANGAPVEATAYLTRSQAAAGDVIELVAKTAADPTTAVIRGDHGWEQRIALTPTSSNAAYLPRLWAQRHIAARLLAKHDAIAPEEREARDEAIRQEVVALGKRYFLLSRHTSLLVLENDAMYAHYGVTKGAGDTWAPYAMPPTIPVAPSPVAMPDDVTDDAELVRTPLELFYTPPSYAYGPVSRSSGWGTIGVGRFGTLGHGSGTGQGYGLGARGRGEGGGGSVTGGLVQDQAEPAKVETKRQVVAASDLDQDSTAQGITLQRSTRDKSSFGIATLSPAHFGYTSDPAYDDLSALVPALFRDAADDWRDKLVPAAAPFPIDPAAQRLLGEARATLPAGIYRWGDLEVAVDTARRIGWRRTTDMGVVETAALDGTTWTRRYAELGLTATRAVRDDDIAVALAYLPIWIADPAHYARYFIVGAKGRDVTLSITKDAVAFVLSFDDSARLTKVADAAGAELVAVTWGPAGPASARVAGRTIAVGFTPQSIADATAWALGDAPAGVTVELPTRVPAYWQALAAKEPAGSPAWRRAQRQLLVSEAALLDRAALRATYDGLAAHGGVELGDIVLASATLRPAKLPLSGPVAQYLAAKPSTPPAATAGAIGGLWQLRYAVSQIEQRRFKDGVDTLVGIQALELRLVGAAALAQRWDVPLEQSRRAWESVEQGAYVNVARVQLAQQLFNRGRYDEGAAEVAHMIDALDLTALPASAQQLVYSFSYSRRGSAGWQVAFATWRDKVLAGTSFEHVMALVPLAAQPADSTALLARAATLATGDTGRMLAVARMATTMGQPLLAKNVLAQLPPSHDSLVLAADVAETSGDYAAALDALTRAQDLGASDPVDIATLRDELRRIDSVAQEVAFQSTGKQRDDAVARAFVNTARWRAIDPGNSEIDRRISSMLLRLGDTKGAWRQLSSIIERDPWSGAGYATVAEQLEQQGRVADALELWQQAIVIDQTNPTHRLRKAQALIALGRTQEGDALLEQIASQKWHVRWEGTVYQAKELLRRAMRPRTKRQ